MGSIDYLVIVSLVAGILYLLGAGFTYWKRSSNPQAARALIIFLFLSAVWMALHAAIQMGWLKALRPDVLKNLPSYGLLVLAVACMMLVRSFLRTEISAWIWWLIGAVWLASLAILDFNFFNLPDTLKFQGNIQVTRQIIVSGIVIFGWTVFMAGTAAYAMRVLKRSSRYYTAISYWAIVLLLLAVGDGFFFARLPAITAIFRLLGSFLAIYIVASPRLPNINHLLRRAFSYLVYSILALILYTICMVAAQVLLRSQPDLTPAYAGFFVAVFLVLLFNPFMGTIQRRVNRWISGEDQDPTHLLRQYSQSITNILDFQLLGTVAVGTASEFLEVKHGFLFLVDHDKPADGAGTYLLRGVKGMGDINPDPGKLRDDGILGSLFRSEHRPVLHSEVEYHPRFGEAPEEERKWLMGLGVEVFIPIHAKNEWIGLLALGPKGSGSAYTDQDMALLGTMADQTAVALENTRLVEGLVRLNNDFRRAYSALDQANRHLERLDRTKSDFISIASHELRTPLTLISGSSQMLLDDPTLKENPYYKQLLSKIHSGTVRLHEIVDSMLDMAKIDTRALELETQPISINDLVTSVVKELKQSATDRKQTVEITGLDKLPAVSADLEALRKVFHHLVVNAIKYTPDAGKITISGKVVEPNLTDLPKGGIEIVVTDTGIGIDPRFQELIFAKFYQTGELALHSTGKTKFKGGGPGLGLAIARGIVQAHHGKIWVESPGHDEVRCPGSQFHVVLPVRPLDDAQQQRAELPSASKILKR